jgi:hypothetical protein
MCACCGEVEVYPPLEFCAMCDARLRIEVADGLYRLGRYLAAWAAFQDWLEERRQVPTT